MKKYTKKVRNKINDKTHNKTHNKTKKTCLEDSSIVKICQSGKFSQKLTNFYNRDNNEKLKMYVANINKHKKFQKYKSGDKRIKYLVNKINLVNKTMNDTKTIKNDFYDYVNKQWLRSTILDQPNYYVEVDDFRIVQNNVYNKLIDYVKTYIKENPTSRKAKCIKNLYKSLLSNSSRKELLNHCNDILKITEEYINPNTPTNIYDILSYANRNEIVSWGAPIQWQMLPDEKNVSVYISHLSPAKLSIYDYLIYITDPADTAEIKKYKAYIKSNFLISIDRTFEACIGKKDHGFNPEDIWDVELELLDAMGCNSIKNDNVDFYNVVTSDELQKDYDFDWTEFTQKLGYKTIPQKIIVSSLNALKCTVKVLKKNWNTPKWKTYWLYIHYRQLIRFEPSLKHIYYEFFKKILEGQPVDTPNDVYTIFGLSMCFNTFLTEQYVKYNYNPIYVEYVKHLVDDIRTLFIHKIERNNWLSPSTKRTAIDKLKKLTPVIGSPGKLREDPLFNYKPNDSYYNLRLLTRWKHNRYVELEGKPVIDIPEIDWQEFKLVGTQAYMVNAYYRPTSNSIYIPLAYLQPPFIDLENRGLEYNLAYIGYTIGHELSHSLDDNGRKFDAKGNLNNWWTDEDLKKFKEKVRDVVHQYETVAARDGITFDAEIGVGEDLADISGMSLLEEYLRDYLVVNNDTDLVRHNYLQQFFVYIAIQGKQVIYKKAIKAQLKINPHPLEKYRVNCPLARLGLFRSLYNIKPKDKMYWSSLDTIW